MKLSSLPTIARATQFLFFWIALVIVLYYGRVLLVPMTFAAILAMLMTPVCRKLDSMGFHRTLSSLACILILRGLNLGIPFISPDLHQGHHHGSGISCHD